MSDPLYSLSYCSRSAIDGTTDRVQAELRRILDESRRNNLQLYITGALLFSGTCFAQVLEGPLGAIEECFERIQGDARHRDVTILHFHAVEGRSFAEWSMAYVGLDEPFRGPDLETPGITSPSAILTTPGGRRLLQTLSGVLRRDEWAASGPPR